MITDSIEVSPRLSDLDTQRHMTSRTYEAFAWQARNHLLEQNGYNLDRLLEEKIVLVPKRNYVKFLREQMPGAKLKVNTTLLCHKKNFLLFKQEVLAENGDLSCDLLLEVQVLKNKKPFEIALTSIEKISAEFESLLKRPKKFTKKCKQIKAPYVMQFSERSIFFDFTPGALWRIFEEGRWQLGNKIGLTEKKIHEMDTITFFTGGTFYFKKIPAAGSELTIYSWIERIDKFRCFMRQDVTLKGSDDVLMSIREEQLIVSLARRRPKKPPTEFLKLFGKYIESTS